MLGNFMNNKYIELVKYYVLASNIVYLIMYSNEGLHQLFTFIFVSLMFIYNKEEQDNSIKSENFEAIIFSGEQDENDNEINYKFDLNRSYLLNINVDCIETYIYLLTFSENQKNIKLTSKCLLNTSNEETCVDLVIFNVGKRIKITTGVTDCVLDVKITNLL